MSIWPDLDAHADESDAFAQHILIAQQWAGQTCLGIVQLDLSPEGVRVELICGVPEAPCSHVLACQRVTQEVSSRSGHVGPIRPGLGVGIPYLH